MKKLVVVVAVLVIMLLSGCGISQGDYEDIVEEKCKLSADLEILQKHYDAEVEEKDIIVTALECLRKKYDALVSERDSSILRILELENGDKNLLKGFETESEFVNWITSHTQPETVYIDDAFDAVYKAQCEGMEDGYLIGIMLTDSGDSWGAPFASAFVGNELYWWYVEDEQVFGGSGFRR